MQEVKFSLIGKSVSRIDSLQKVTGALKFFGDIRPEGMLYGLVYRSPVPHGIIESIDYEKALSASGVVKVLSAKDIPGTNAYGPYMAAPILAEKKVRYYGEPILLIAAESPEAARLAAELVDVKIRPLKCIGGIDESLSSETLIHDKGNVADHQSFSRGNLQGAKEASDIIVENVYTTQYQKHVFLEPEEGLAYVDESGRINVFYGGQNPYGDRKIIASALMLQEDRVRVASYPTGGSFGGKEESAFPAHLALLAYYTKRPVGIFYSREESGIAGFHRHAAKIELTTGATKDGRLTFNEAKAYADTGAYMIWGPNVLATIMETVNGPYRYDAVKLDGFLVYTNNGVSSAFRGFGAPQGNFAIEQNIDEIAIRLGMDPIELRLKNLLRDGDVAPLGNTARAMSGIRRALEMAGSEELHEPSDAPWYIRHAVGVSLGMKGVAYGSDVDDPSTVSIEFMDDGSVVIGFSNTDYGQGIITGHAQIVAEKLGIDIKSIKVANADTESAPDSGSSNASRSTVTGGKALELACEDSIAYMKVYAADALKVDPTQVRYEDGYFWSGESRISLTDVVKHVKRLRGITKFTRTYYAPKVDRPVSGMKEAPRFFNSFDVLKVLVRVNLLTGEVKLTNAIAFVDGGRIINPQIASGQVEGGLIMGVGYTLTEELRYRDCVPQNINYTTYVVPTAADVPKIKVTFVDSYEPMGPFGAKGIGEIGIVAVASAVGNALRRALGKRITSLPFLPEKLIK